MRSTRALLGCLSIGLSLACTPQQQPPPEDSEVAVQESTRKPAPPPVGAWVRLDRARMLSAPNPDARLTVESGHPFRIAELVAIVEDRFVELRMLDIQPEARCRTSSYIDENFDLRFYAEIDALQTVLTKPKVVDLGDGQKHEFAAGVPVDFNGAEPRLDIGDGESLVVPLTADEIGWWYAPPPEHESPRRKCGLYDTKGPQHGLPKMMRNYNMERMLTVCPGWQAAEGVTLTWRESGTVAGVTRQEVKLPLHARESEGKVCFTAVDFPVCIATEQLSRAEVVCLREDAG